MSTELREALHRAANAVPPMGDAERAVRSGRRRRRAATVGAPLAVLAVVGGVWFVFAGSLGSNEPPVADTSPSSVTAADLAGRAFVTTDGPADDAPVMLMFRGTELTVTVAQGSNTADYRIDDGVLVLEPTTFVCGGPGCRSDLPDLLYSQPTVALAGAELTLTDAERTVTLTESDAVLPQPDATLTGWAWALESYSDPDDPSSYVGVPEGVQSTLDFGDGALTARFGCNAGRGDVTVTDSTIEVGLMDSTDVGCTPPVMSVEQAVKRVLWDDDGVLAYTIEGDTLTLTGDLGQLVYRISLTEPDPRLVGTDWRLTGAAGSASLAIAPDGSLQLEFGCSSGTGRVTFLDGDTFTVDRLSTEDGCSGVDTEYRTQQVLTGDVTYRIEGGTLTLSSDGGELVYQAGSVE